MLHIKRLGPRVEPAERADDPVAEAGIVLEVMHFLMSVDIIPVGVCRATEAEANSPDMELTRALVGIVRNDVTLGAKEVWPFKYAIFLPEIICCSQGDER